MKPESKNNESSLKDPFAYEKKENSNQNSDSEPAQNNESSSEQRTLSLYEKTDNSKPELRQQDLKTTNLRL